MDESDKPQTYRKAIWTCLAIVLLVPPLYVLSIGPAVWLMVNGYITEGTVNAIYTPLLLKDGETIPPLGEWVEWYLRFWV
jgi:hypothetical protein